ncbi:hypothetical protein SLEP1_g33315 [Rubroshorea leprosula]|uniref:RING-type E3 ubiquitin transferase n=1 Tax=Rubroshorea leprosula TaxID=152421 RepID=A0AAV5KG98_9ROSI|nr:hypothetical protein SLEP1_g33315 [Rubroshorea leprosula]
MPVLEEGSSSSSTIAEHMKGRRPRNQIMEADPTSEIPSLIQSTRCKPTISSLFLSTFSTSNNGGNETVPTNTNTNTNVTPKKKATQSTFRALGCTASASQQVSVPAVIRTSADWEAKKVKKKTQKQEKKKKKGSDSSNNKVANENSKVHQGFVSDGGNGNGCGVIQDVWCGPGIGFSADAVGSVDCVVARRNVSARGKIDGEKISHRERSCLPRRTVTPEAFSFLDSDSGFVSSHPEPDFFASRYYRHVRHPSPEGLAEIFMLQNSLLMGGRSESRDQFSDWRLDVDHMTYEQLLDLGDRIGHVNTGLKEDEVSKCLRRTKHSLLNDLQSNVPVHMDGKCSICQEEYEADDEMGKLYCGHGFHIQCIKQWLAQKKTCPVCKTEATA